MEEKNETILEIHPSGKAVAVKSKYRLQEVLIRPQLLNGFLSDDDFKNDHSDYMHSRDFLVMPVHVSPLLCFIQQLPLKARYTDSFQTISILRTIVQCFRVNPFLQYTKEHTRQIIDSHDWMIMKTNEMEEAMFKALEETDDLKGFIAVMEKSTLARIHILEETVWRMFGFEKHFPLNYGLTPPVTPSLQGDLKEFRQLMAHYFVTKQFLRNTRMSKSVPEEEEYESIRYFDVDAIRDARRDDLYKNYLDSETTKEYKLFLKL